LTAELDRGALPRTPSLTRADTAAHVGRPVCRAPIASGVVNRP
jgi:hypothetical protein